MNYYSSAEWRRLSRQTKKRDCYQCQVCGDREGDPHTVLNAHHIIPRAKGGPDTLDNLITLCDLCHAVVTPRWLKPWFPDAVKNDREGLERVRVEYLEFLALDPATRLERQAKVWETFGIRRAQSALIQSFSSAPMICSTSASTPASDFAASLSAKVGENSTTSSNVI